MLLNRNIRIVQRLIGQSGFLLNCVRTRQLQTTSLRLCTIKEEKYFVSKYIKDLVKENPELEKFGNDSILRTYDTLVDIGFTTENAYKMINIYPMMVRFPPQKLYQRFEMWHVCSFTPTQMFQLFSECPEFFDFDDEVALRNRLAELKTYVHTDKNVWRLFMSAPNVLTDKLEIFLKKADYLEKNMQVDFTDAVKSGVFASPLNTIKCRHMLLVRLGIYKPKNKKTSELSTTKNPRMTRIIDSTDEYFANELCGISLAELTAFNALYTRELQEKEDEEKEKAMNSDDGSDSDYSDEEDEDDANKDVETEAFASEKFIKKKPNNSFRGKKKFRK